MTMLPVSTPAFEGPLDLLLHLIERDDLDITAVSLVQVTDQYLAALRAGDEIDLRGLADFVAVGAKLLFLKSRALLPRTADEVAADDREAEEIAQDLTERLQEYRAFKTVASHLHELQDAGHRSYVRVAPAPLDWLPTGLEKVTLKRLLGALEKALERLPPAEEPAQLQRPLINVAERRLEVVDAVRRRGSLTFSRLIAGSRSRLEAIITFLAVLDLLKTEELRAEQSSTFGDIVLRPADHSPGAVATA